MSILLYISVKRIIIFRHVYTNVTERNTSSKQRSLNLKYRNKGSILKHFTKRQNFILFQIESVRRRQKLKVAKTAVFVPDTVQNNVEIGENADYQHFLLFPHCFQKSSLPGSLKTGNVLEKG